MVRFGRWPSGCYYCGCPMDDYNPKSPRARTLDHKQPKSRGGKGRPNKVPACRSCNGEKGNMTVAEYRAWIIAGRPDQYAYKWTIPYFRVQFLKFGAPEPDNGASERT